MKFTLMITSVFLASAILYAVKGNTEYAVANFVIAVCWFGVVSVFKVAMHAVRK